MELFKKEWGPDDDPDGTIINASILEDGSLKIDGTDYGAGARSFSGRDDYEYGLVIPADQVAPFTLALLRRSFHLRSRIRFSTIEKICKNANITYKAWYL